MEDVKENVGWSIGGGAGCCEWMTVPEDLAIAVLRLNILSLPSAVFRNFVFDYNSSDKKNNTENSPNKCWRLSPKNKYSISYVELFIVRWRTWGHLGPASLFLLHVAYTSVLLY